jgi:foldase protein PrsA
LFVRRELAALRVFTLLIVAATLCGCDQTQPPPGPTVATNPPPAPTTSPSPADVVVATVRGHDVTMSELQGPLVEAYGLNVMLELVQLDMAQQDAQQAGVTVTDADIEDEATRTLTDFRKATRQDQLAAAATEPSGDTPDETLSPAEREQELTLLLTGQHLTRTEFYLAMHRNAILRKLVTPLVQTSLTDDLVRERFNAIYGEKARVRFIKLSDMLAVSNVEKALQSGRTFEEEVSLHPYDSNGHPSAGEIPPFSRKDNRFPAEFRMVAFGLKPGEVSDPLQIKDSIYLVQLIELIPPAHANFDDYKDSVRRDLYEQEVQDRIRAYLTKLGADARASIEIKDPVLEKQWQTLRDADELREKLRQEQAAGTTQPAAPATAPEN